MTKHFGPEFDLTAEDYKAIIIENIEKKAAEITAAMEKAEQKNLEEIFADLKRRGYEIPYILERK